MKYKHLLDEKKGRKNDISKFMIKSYHCHPSINLTFCKMNHINHNFTCAKLVLSTMKILDDQIRKLIKAS